MADLSSVTTSLQPALEYLYSLPDEIMRGNVFAIAISLILIFFAITIIQKFTTLLVFVLKKIFLLIIVVLAFYEFIRMFALRIAAEGITTDTIIFGTVGATVGIIATVIALYVAFRSIRTLRGKPVQGAKPQLPKGEEIPSASPLPADEPRRGKEPEPAEKPMDKSSLSTSMRENLSLESLKSDKHIGAVIAYIIIAEFGVFSSKTIAAPTLEAGLAFFVIFMLASVVFIRMTYHDFWKGTQHLAVALVIGGTLSIILGYSWGAIPLDRLLSLSYFTTDALVALITGLALSLFMGSMK
jgi:hypothetical protein